jgi:hypothetical protein
MAISLSRSQIAYRAWVIAADGLDEASAGILFADIEEFIEEAVQKLCDQIANSNQYHRLQTTFSVSLSGGQATLPDECMSDTIMDSHGGRVLHSTMKYPLNNLPSITDLKYPQAGGSEVGFYNVQGGNASGGIIYASDGAGNVLTGSLTILACAYQTFSTLAPQLEDELIDVLVDMARSKRMMKAAGVQQ